MHTRGSVKVGAETILGMLYEYKLAYASVLHYPHFPFRNILLAQTCLCVFAYMPRFLSTRPLNDP